MTLIYICWSHCPALRFCSFSTHDRHTRTSLFLTLLHFFVKLPWFCGRVSACVAAGSNFNPSARLPHGRRADTLLLRGASTYIISLHSKGSKLLVPIKKALAQIYSKKEYALLRPSPRPPTDNNIIYYYNNETRHPSRMALSDPT